MEGLTALVGVVVGSAGTYLIERATWNRGELLTARLEVAQVSGLLWDWDSIQPLELQLAAVKVRLATLKVPGALFENLREAAVAAWRDGLERMEQAPDPEYYGISTTKLDAVAQAIQAVDQRLARPRAGRSRAAE